MNKISDWINENKEEKYAEFSSKITTSRYPLLGVRIPKLKSKAKELIKAKDINALEDINCDSFEEMMLRGMVIAYSGISLKEKETLLYQHLCECDNWALIDTLCTCFKLKGKEKEEMYQLICDYWSDEHTYVVRFAIVMSMHYNDDEHIDDILEHCCLLERKEYTLKMANSWLLQDLSVNYFDKVIKIIDKLDDETKRYYKRKMLDSFKIIKERKEIVRRVCLKN